MLLVIAMLLASTAKHERVSMKFVKRPWFQISAGMLLIGLAAGCSSEFTTIIARPPEHPQKLGMVEGSACGSQFLAFIPIASNSRTERAYNDALAKAPGAKALMNVTLQENWYWYYLGTIRSVTISGEAVK